MRLYLNRANKYQLTQIIDSQEFFAREFEVDEPLGAALLRFQAEVIAVERWLAEQYQAASRRDYDIDAVMPDEIRSIVCRSGAKQEPKQEQQATVASSSKTSSSGRKKKASKSSTSRKKKSSSTSKSQASTSQTDDSPTESSSSAKDASQSSTE